LGSPARVDGREDAERARVINLKDYGDRESWLAARAQWIGASEVAALFVSPTGECMSPFTTPFALWAEKTGLAQPAELDAEYVEWGNLLEPAIAGRYARVTGREIWQAPSPYAVAEHPSLPMLRATPDRWVLRAEPERAGDGLLQLKNTNAFATDWNDGPPDYVQIQVQAEMAVTGRDWCSVAVLIGGCRFRYFDVERNDAFIAEIEAQVRWFWERHVIGGVPPDLDASERTLSTIKRMHPADNGQTIALDAEALIWLKRWERAKRIGKLAELAQTRAETELRARIGGNTYAELPDGRTLSLKTSTRPERVQVVNGTTYRTLRALRQRPALGQSQRPGKLLTG
jgi:putative phage-type endonuclease